MTQENSEMFSACTNGHVRFNEQEEHGTTIALPTTKDEKRVAVSDTDSDADSSDDDVPEEEGLSSAKDTIEEQLRQRESVLQKERELLKEKRKRQNLRFVQQQEEKRQKQEEEKQRKILEFEASLKANEAADEQELEELGDQFFDELEAQASKKISVKPTKINFNDIDYNYTEDVKIELKKQKRKTLKALRRTTMKRGPVKVTVLPSLDNRSFVPKKEEHAVNFKDKWLRRRALKRK